MTNDDDDHTALKLVRTETARNAPPAVAGNGRCQNVLRNRTPSWRGVPTSARVAPSADG